MNINTRKQGIVWGGLLILLGVMGLLELNIDISTWTWAAVLFGAGLIALLIFLTDRKDTILLLPAYILWAVAGLIALLELNVLQDELVAVYVLSAVAIPFLVIYLRYREQWWALIPAYVMLAIIGMLLLTEAGLLEDELVAGYVMFAVAIPFFVVYLRNKKYWWALIPGGIMAIIGLAFFAVEAAFELIIAVVLILVGGWIILRQFIRREPVETEAPPIEIPDPDASTEE
jgi:hypothetical protein